MRKIVVSILVSLDCYIEGKNPKEHWHNWNDEMTDYTMDFFSTVDTFIYGRKAYEDMIAYWPSHDDPFAKIMNATPKFVFSRTLKDTTWNSTLYKELDPDEMQKEKEKPGKDMVIFAGADIIKSFRKFDLIDEYRLIVNPVILGGGKPLFKDIKDSVSLTLKSSKTFDCGNVLLIYE